MTANVSAILEIIAWIMPRVINNIGTLHQLNNLAAQENASVPIRAFLRQQIDARQKIAEGEAL